MKQLKWNVYVYSFNSRQIVTFNIFDHEGFKNDILKIPKKISLDDFNLFKEQLRRELMYYYWCKCEWEIIISPWPTHDNDPEIKVDVYSQVMLNFDVFAEYVFNTLRNRRRKKKETTNENKDNV